MFITVVKKGGRPSHRLFQCLVINIELLSVCNIGGHFGGHRSPQETRCPPNI